MFEWPPPDSPAARLDEQDFLARVAKDLNKFEPPKRAPTPIRSGITQAQLDRRLSRLCEALGRGIRKLVVEPLERKIADLEQKQLKLGGVWKAGERYKENTLVSFQGGLWISRADTTARPGSGSPSWRLCVKKGDGYPK